MSTCAAASARSRVSVAVHMANRKPPLETYSRILRATAFFMSGTVPKPRRFAASALNRTMSASHVFPA